jgi:chromosomal replication initiation ATPase DnaA
MVSIEDYVKEKGISVPELYGKSRVFHTALAREVYWLYLKKNGLTLYEIARMFNRKQHSTVLSGIRTAKNLLSTKEEWALFCIDALNMNPDDFF